jgi:hypothetical protein
VSSLPVFGAVIRHAFYLVGALVFALVGIKLLLSGRPAAAPQPAQTMSQAPAFRLTDTDLARKHKTSHVINLPGMGRIEAWQYGQLSERDSDLTIALFVQPQSLFPVGDVNLEMARLRAFNLLQGMGPFGTGRYYDLHIRFGEVRATEMQADADGVRKPCLGFVSRFDTMAAHIAGWYCTQNGAKPAASELACLLDGLAIEAPLASEEADSFFRKAGAKAPTCSAEPVTQTIDARTVFTRPGR